MRTPHSTQGYMRYQVDESICSYTVLAITERLCTCGKSRLKLARSTLLSSLVLLSSGASLIIFSVLTRMSVPTFLGLGLVFLGLVPFYLRNGSQSFHLDPEAPGRSLQDILEKRNQAIYLPTPTSEGLTAESCVVAEEAAPDDSLKWTAVKSKEKFHLKRVEAPGTMVLAQLERTLGTDLSEVKPSFLASHLPTALVRDLKLAEAVRLTGTKDRFQVEIRSTRFTDTCAKAVQQVPPFDSLGCEICSAIALALAKATGKSIVIEETGVDVGDGLIRTKFSVFPIIFKEA